MKINPVGLVKSLRASQQLPPPLSLLFPFHCVSFSPPARALLLFPPLPSLSPLLSPPLISLSLFLSSSSSSSAASQLSFARRHLHVALQVFLQESPHVHELEVGVEHRHVCESMSRASAMRALPASSEMSGNPRRRSRRHLRPAAPAPVPAASPQVEGDALR
eukprot:761348-Hanusia_phi.AAC.1